MTPKRISAPRNPHLYQAAPISRKSSSPPMPTASETPITHSQNFQPSSSMPLPSEIVS
jgi:hypothetical protein